MFFATSWIAIAGFTPARQIILSDYFKECKRFDTLQNSQTGEVSAPFTLTQTLLNGVPKQSVHEVLGAASGICNDFRLQSEWFYWVDKDTKLTKVSEDSCSRLFGCLHFLVRVQDRVFGKMLDEDSASGKSIIEYAIGFLHLDNEKKPIRAVNQKPVLPARGRFPFWRSNTPGFSFHTSKEKPFRSHLHPTHSSRYQTLHCSNCQKSGHHTSRCWQKLSYLPE